MSKQKRATSAKTTSDTPRRQVVVLHAKPRGEYQRGVRVTARKLYFGEWSRAAFVASDEFGGEIALERPQQTSRPQGQTGRPQGQGNRPASQSSRGGDSRPNQPARTGQSAQNQPRGAQPDGQTDSGVTIRPTQTAAQREQAKASRIAELKRRSEQTLERNASRAVRGPMEGSSSNQPMQGSSDAAAISSDATTPNAARAEGAPHRRRRRGGRGGNKTPAA